MDLLTPRALEGSPISVEESQVVFRRLGSVTGQDKAGRIRVVSVYSDSGGYKLCGPSGSQIVDAPLADIHQEAANAFDLEDTAFVPSTRAA